MTFSFQDLKDILEYSIMDTEDFLIDIQGLLFGIVIFILTYFFIRLIRRLFNRMVNRGILNRPTSVTLYTVIKYFIWVLVSIMILNSFGLKVSVLFASVAALLVGVGIGMQKLFNDIASGIVMLIERNVVVTDIIELEDGPVGRVESIGLRTSKIRTRDDIIMIIPNSKFVNDMFISWSHFTENTRFHIDVHVALDSDTEKVKRLLLQSLEGVENVLSHPQPFVQLSEFGEYSLDFELYFWSPDSFGVEKTKSNIRFNIDRLFRDHRVEIPIPQRELRMRGEGKLG